MHLVEIDKVVVKVQVHVKPNLWIFTFWNIFSWQASEVDDGGQGEQGGQAWLHCGLGGGGGEAVGLGDIRQCQDSAENEEDEGKVQINLKINPENKNTNRYLTSNYVYAIIIQAWHCVDSHYKILLVLLFNYLE